jgi:hypothetical protein
VRHLLQSKKAMVRADPDTQKPDVSQPPKRKPRLIWLILRGLMWCVIGLILIGLIARPFMPWAVRWYVNRTLDQSILYRGKIGDLNLHLWRGAYTIHDVRISKTTGDIPVPLFSTKQLELAVQWNALLHGRVVGQVVMAQPEVNFVDDPDPANSETGAGGPWLKMLRDLFPFDLNRAELHDGSIHFRTYQKAKPVDVYLSHVEASIDDLQNINHSMTPLLATVRASATAMDQGKLDFQMKLDPFSYNPTFHLALRLLGLDITKTNPLLETYGGFNVKRGFFDLVVDIDCKEGELDGYVKPLFRNMVIFDLVQDVKEDNGLQVFWQALVGGTAAIVTNYNRDQLGTLVPFTGELKSPGVDYLAAIGNVLRNAFIRAYLPRLEKTRQTEDDLKFGPPSLIDPISVGDQQ